MRYARVYVAQLGSMRLRDAYWYVGTTECLPAQRHEAHKVNMKGQGAAWCKKHGYLGMRICVRVEPNHANTLENDLTKYLMATFGWQRVRGGDHMVTDPDPNDLWWLPLQWRNSKIGDKSYRNILKLRTGSVSKFSAELRGLVDSFLASSGPKHPHELDTDSFPEPFFG
jgi:hypothetical protein